MAGLSIEEASGRGGLSPNFWGNVERNEKEPCLDIICSLAKGLGITPDVLMTLEGKDRQNQDRQELDTLLDLFTPSQLQLAIQVSKLIYAYKPGASLPASQPPSREL
jgi:transcriptional regulator with XRE-family HTH domain